MFKIVPFEENDKKASASHLQVTTALPPAPPPRERRAPREVTRHHAPAMKAEAPVLLEKRTPPSLCSYVRLC